METAFTIQLFEEKKDIYFSYPFIVSPQLKIAKERKVIPDPIDDRKFQE